jgi:H+/Cl- antiporter ClcA
MSSPRRANGERGNPLRELLRVDPREQLVLLVHLARWSTIGAVIGVVAGLASAAFLKSLEWATDTRIDHPALLWGLPLFGLATGLVYHYLGGRSAGGSSMIIDEVHDPRTWVPRRMVPLIFVFTVAGHLFGASVGREGAAVQMSAGLTDAGARALGITGATRRLVLITAVAGGFGSIFGVPLAGAVFALEVLAIGRIRYDALVPAFAASLVGYRVVVALGIEHVPTPTFAEVDLTFPLVAKLAAAGIAFGLAALVFAELTHGIRHLFASYVAWPPARTLLGGIAVVALTYAVDDRAYLGLSIPLVTASLAGGLGIAAGAFALKLVFTSVSLGSGFQGGEVIPLFVIGATLGVSMARLMDAPVPLLAAVGFVAVFAGATNTPLACTVIAIELFGASLAVPAAIACIVSYVVSAERGIYASQRIDTPLLLSSVLEPGLTVGELSGRRRHWLAPRRQR